MIDAGDCSSPIESTITYDISLASSSQVIFFNRSSRLTVSKNPRVVAATTTAIRDGIPGISHNVGFNTNIIINVSTIPAAAGPSLLSRTSATSSSTAVSSSSTTIVKKIDH
uniref:Uncharacterized protein n=1 Tax=Romanomermis culicivorax TaxID=13658 RepID=A0A915JSR6_ROMCU